MPITTRNKIVYAITAALIIGIIIVTVFRIGVNHSPRKIDYSAPVLLPENRMVLIPAGWFLMGSNDGEQDERPVHKVWIDSFYIDMFPVTNSEYAEFILATGYRKPRYWNNPDCSDPAQPVVGVNVADASAYCVWRTQTQGGRFRLPTEAEWEKAARGEDGRIYPWGNNRPTEKHANTKLRKEMPKIGICDLGASPYGVKDMVGNVWNWCLDWYDKDFYSKSPENNPTGPNQRGRRGNVVRGGNWVFLGCCSGTPEYSLRVSRRNAFHEDLQKKSIGFRCVREVERKSD